MRKKYSIYDQEFYVIIQALKKWRHYLLPKEFVLFTDHKVLQYINSQGKLNQKHYKWIEFLRSYMFFWKHMSGKSNKVVDALSRRKVLLINMLVVVVSLECVKGLYEDDADFTEAWKACREPWSMDRTPFLDYHIQEGFLFKNQHLCVPYISVQLNLVRELHNGGLGVHCGMDKTTSLVKKWYFCPNINKDVRKSVVL
jgi:hypothetical protein